MYAVIKTGGKQYLVAKGDVIDVEKLEGEKGAKLTLDSVLMVSDSNIPKLGTPFVDGATVAATIEEQFRDKKIIIYKKKRRKGYEVRNGHRQSKTKLKITAINA